MGVSVIETKNRREEDGGDAGLITKKPILRTTPA